MRELLGVEALKRMTPTGRNGTEAIPRIVYMVVLGKAVYESKNYLSLFLSLHIITEI